MLKEVVKVKDETKNEFSFAGVDVMDAVQVEEGDTFLHIAARGGDTDTIEFLLKSRPDMQAEKCG